MISSARERQGRLARVSNAGVRLEKINSPGKEREATPSTGTACQVMQI